MMENNSSVDRLYLIDRLRTGKSLNIVFMSHNAYWSQVDILSDRYKNCRVQVFGCGTAYLEMATFSHYYEPIDDCDLIILRATNYDESEYIKMKSLAHTISKEKNKIVTIGYSYFNPDYKTADFNREFIIKLAKIKDDFESEETKNALNLHPLDLVNYTLIKHDNLEYREVYSQEDDEYEYSSFDGCYSGENGWKYPKCSVANIGISHPAKELKFYSVRDWVESDEKEQEDKTKKLTKK